MTLRVLVRRLRDRLWEWLRGSECDGCRYEIDRLHTEIRELENVIEYHLAEAVAVTRPKPRKPRKKAKR